MARFYIKSRAENLKQEAKRVNVGKCINCRVGMLESTVNDLRRKEV